MTRSIAQLIWSATLAGACVTDTQLTHQNAAHAAVRSSSPAATIKLPAASPGQTITSSDFTLLMWVRPGQNHEQTAQQLISGNAQASRQQGLARSIFHINNAMSVRAVDSRIEVSLHCDACPENAQTQQDLTAATDSFASPIVIACINCIEHLLCGDVAAPQRYRLDDSIKHWFALGVAQHFGFFFADYQRGSLCVSQAQLNDCLYCKIRHAYGAFVVFGNLAQTVELLLDIASNIAGNCDYVDG